MKPFAFLFALAVAACSGTATPTGPTAPATVLTGETGSITMDRASSRDSVIACPSDPVINLLADTFGKRADLTFEAPGIPAGTWTYEARIVRRQTGEIFYAQNNGGATRIEWQNPMEDGTFDAVVYRKTCSSPRPSAPVTFSYDTLPKDAPPPVMPPVVIDPTPAPVVAACSDTLFVRGVTANMPVPVPSGPHTLVITTYDAGHKAGYQTDQQDERLWVSLNGALVGRTIDIPDAQTSQLTRIPVVGPAPFVTLFSYPSPSSPNSVHGACVSVE